MNYYCIFKQKPFKMKDLPLHPCLIFLKMEEIPTFFSLGHDFYTSSCSFLLWNRQCSSEQVALEALKENHCSPPKLYAHLCTSLHLCHTNDTVASRT